MKEEFFKCKQPVRRIRQGQNETSAEFRTDRLLTDDDNAEKRPGSDTVKKYLSVDETKVRIRITSKDSLVLHADIPVRSEKE